jgi:hypothetical protein
VLFYLAHANRQVPYIYVSQRLTNEVSTAGLYRFADVYKSVFGVSIVINPGERKLRSVYMQGDLINIVDLIMRAVVKICMKCGENMYVMWRKYVCDVMKICM